MGAGSWDGDITLWDVRTGRQSQLPSKVHKGPVYSLGFSWPSAKDSESLLASVGADGALQLWSYSGQQLEGQTRSLSQQQAATYNCPSNQFELRYAAFSPGNLLFVA